MFSLFFILFLWESDFFIGLLCNAKGVFFVREGLTNNLRLKLEVKIFAYLYLKYPDSHRDIQIGVYTLPEIIVFFYIGNGISVSDCCEKEQIIRIMNNINMRDRKMIINMFSSFSFSRLMYPSSFVLNIHFFISIVK